MFYSQFILAKKGPLGTIWIAAHLERKLRKNQVADTDIGVSVDSILFPEVPIALRLSSHLLLGVVRIYSRKVNYLFHDCSEALLKIKQAFRSTTVDLPPEESTAPYHSITLPETFDLDDFELPDFGFSHGNYVDHHISTREQITLQDTMDDMVFSTSQFGLDERFGDADASQLALDFDEDLFLDRAHSPVHTSVFLSLEDDVHEQVDDQTKTSITSVEFDEHPQDVAATHNSGSVKHTEQVPSLSCDEQAGFKLLNSGGNGSANLTGIGIRSPELIKESLPCSIDQEQLLDPQGEVSYPTVHSESGINNEEDYPSPAAQAPSTPGLTEKAIPVRVHGVSSLGSPRKGSLLYPGDSLLKESDNSKPAARGSDDGKIMESVMPTDIVDSLNNRDCDDVMEIDQGSNRVQIILPNNDDANEQQGPDTLHGATVILDSGDPKVVNSSEVTSQEISEDLRAVNHVECKDCSAPHQIVAVASAEDDARICASSIVLRPCNGIVQAAHPVNLQDKSAEEVILNKADHGCLDIAQLEVAHVEESEYPRFETLCSAPPEASDFSEDLVAKDSSAGDSSLLSNERGMFVGETISGKKRMTMDSSPILLDGNPSKTSKLSQSARSVNFIPDDDDVLASILVGRRTPIFKIKSTPTAEIVSPRRPQASTKASAQKRKVPLDDTMVLHGDVIRQQLTSTEDIRRVRRKAPCTPFEIWRIQKLASADGIFSEPLLSGLCTEITCLYRKALVLTGDGVFSVTSKGTEPMGDLEFVKEPSSHTVDESLRISLESNCLQAQESADTVMMTHNSLSHSSEGLKDADGTLPHEPGICLNGNSATNGTPSDVQLEKDTLVGSPAAEPLLDNRSAGLSDHASVITINGTTELDPCHSGKGSDGDRVGLTVTEKHSDYYLDKDAPIEGDMPVTEATQHKHGLVDIGDNEAIEDHHLLGEKSDTLVAGRVSVESDPPHQGLDNGEISSTILPGLIQFEHSVSKGNENLSSVGNDRSNHEGAIYVNNADDKCALGNENIMVNHDDMLSAKHVDVDNVASCPESRQSEAQLDPMHIEDATDHRISMEPLLDKDNAVECTSSGKCLDQFEVLNYVADENAIEFLNEDNEPEVEEDGGASVSPAGHEKIEDNSGWSVRTRGVAKYLKSLFESLESNSNRLGLAIQKSVPLDRLLAGKTRKEASRMFFETLVLKTRDYVHVEQRHPFDSIDVGSKLKLMKSEF